MNVTTQEIEFCKVKASYTADTEFVKEKKDEVVSFFQKQKIPGFRKNKASKLVILNKYKQQIEDNLKQLLLNQAYEDVIFETKMRSIGQPQMLSINLKGNSFTCDLLFLKKPDFELKDFNGMKVVKPSSTKNETEIAEAQLQELRVSAGSFKAYDENDFVQLKDKVTLSLDVFVDDKKSEELSEEGKLYVVGSGLFKEFDENIVGMTSGEDREFDVLLDNKTKAHVKTTLHTGLRQTAHPLNDELAKAFGKETLVELREAVTGMATNQVKAEVDAKINEQIKLQLIQMHDIVVPTWLQQMESQQIAAFDKINLESCTPEVLEHYMDRAKIQVQFALILDSIQQTIPEAMLTDAEAMEVVKNKLVTQGYDYNNVVGDKNNANQLYGMMISAKNEFTLGYIIDKAEIIE